MSGKGAKGLITAGKTSAANNANKDKDKDSKKKPVSRSSRAGLQVIFNLSHYSSFPFFLFLRFALFFNYMYS